MAILNISDVLTDLDNASRRRSKSGPGVKHLRLSYSTIALPNINLWFINLVRIEMQCRRLYKVELE